MLDPDGSDRVARVKTRHGEVVAKNVEEHDERKIEREIARYCRDATHANHGHFSSKSGMARPHSKVQHNTERDKEPNQPDADMNTDDRQKHDSHADGDDDMNNDKEQCKTKKNTAENMTAVVI